MVFSDLVGSTALSARTDPEDLREVISAYQKCEVHGRHDDLNAYVVVEVRNDFVGHVLGNALPAP
jgi:class 3 adenylate cyclase